MLSLLIARVGAAVRLKEIRKSRHLKQQDVADILNIKLRTYQNYEREINGPGIDVICKLADYYEVTTDYLVGLSDQENNYPDELLLVLYKKLNREGKMKLLEYANDLNQIERYQKKEMQNNTVSDVA